MPVTPRTTIRAQRREFSMLFPIRQSPLLPLTRSNRTNRQVYYPLGPTGIVPYAADSSEPETYQKKSKEDKVRTSHETKNAKRTKDETAHDRRTANEKNLRERTEIEFFERGLCLHVSHMSPCLDVSPLPRYVLLSRYVARVYCHLCSLVCELRESRAMMINEKRHEKRQTIAQSTPSLLSSSSYAPRL